MGYMPTWTQTLGLFGASGGKFATATVATTATVPCHCARTHMRVVRSCIGAPTEHGIGSPGAAKLYMLRADTTSMLAASITESMFTLAVTAPRNSAVQVKS